MARIISKLKNLVPSRFYARKYYEQWDSIQGRRLFLLNTAGSKNLGDHAITLAEYAFFQHFFPTYPIIELTSQEWRLAGGKALARHVRQDDIIFLHGGGYMGTLWGGGEENNAMNIIKHFPHNKIIFLPQTVFYEKSDRGRRMLAERVKFYSHYPNILFFQREEQSFKFMQENFGFLKDRCLLTPDIVLFLHYPKYTALRKGVLLCLRKDEEKITNESFPQTIENFAFRAGEPVTKTDTVAESTFPLNLRREKVNSKLNQFRSSRLVVADRLHAMIFAAITGTPCIALDNLNGKVGGVYKWINSLKYICFLRQSDLTEDVFDRFLKETATRSYEYPPSLLADQYAKMAYEIARFANIQPAKQQRNYI